jgi:hypothetical protein
MCFDPGRLTICRMGYPTLCRLNASADPNLPGPTILIDGFALVLLPLLTRRE